MSSGSQRSLANLKLGGWTALYVVAMAFIGVRIFARMHIFGSLAIDDWLMIVAAIAYSASMITEVFVWIAFRDYDVLGYIKVFSSQFGYLG
jgi:hypothetical protein